MRRALALLMLMAVGPAVAVAHGVLDRTEPRAGVRVKAPPPQVRLWFTGALEPAYSRVEVLDASGKRMDLGDGGQIGRASCRERAAIGVVTVAGKKHSAVAAVGRGRTAARRALG